MLSVARPWIHTQGTWQDKNHKTFAKILQIRSITKTYGDILIRAPAFCHK